ncbi:unnamed protein product, partial [marine sediment metagenome]
MASIHNFHESTQSISPIYDSSIVLNSAFSFGDESLNEDDTRLAIMLEQPFRVNLRLTAEEEEDKWVDLYKFSKDIPEECSHENYGYLPLFYQWSESCGYK